MDKINVLFEDNHILVVEKPINILSQADDTNDIDMISILKDYLKVKYQKPGNVFVGLVHRLDRPVGGVMVFAKTSKAASRLSEQVRTNQLTKTYVAITTKQPPLGMMEHYLLKDTKSNMVKVDSKGKLSQAIIKEVSKAENFYASTIELITGRSHQLRVQLSAIGCPIWGDQRYNREAKEKQQIALFAKKLCFYHPITKEKLCFELAYPNQSPFNYFNVSATGQ